MILTRIGRRGQMTLPREIRRRLQVQEGDRIAFVSQDSEIVLKPLTRTLLDLRGSVPVSRAQDFAKTRRQVLKVRAARAARET